MIKKLFNTQIETGQIHLALLILRLSLGGMMLTHGWPKFQKVISGDFSFGDPLGIGEGISLVLAVIAEFFGSIMIMTGFGTRIAAFLIGFTMFVAGFVHHADDPFSRKEKAFMYLAGFVVLWVSGPGKYSVDRRMGG